MAKQLKTFSLSPLAIQVLGSLADKFANGSKSKLVDMLILEKAATEGTRPVMRAL